MARQVGRSRQRMLESAVELLRERGASGVSIDAVLARSGAPRGSVYHHFPGGRSELILTAVRQAGDLLTGLIDPGPDGDPRALFDRFVSLWKQSLAHSDFTAGCPIVALAVEHRDDLPEATELVREIFAEWRQRISAILGDAGVPADRARRLAVLTVSAIEGAIVLCRAERSVAPLDDVAAEMGPLFPRAAA